MITHGHEDHLGGLPWLLGELGAERVPVVYGRRLTAAMAKSKLDEHKLRTPSPSSKPATCAPPAR